MAVVLAVRVSVEAAPLLPSVNVLPAKLTIPDVMFNIPVVVTELFIVICGKVPNVLLRVRLLKVVAPVILWAAVPLRVTVPEPGVKVPLFDQLPAKLIFALFELLSNVLPDPMVRLLLTIKLVAVIETVDEMIRLLYVLLLFIAIAAA